MLVDDITNKRKERHHITQEDFTPLCVCEILNGNIENELYQDFNKNFCDIAAGNGNIIRCVIKERLNYCNSQEDILNALKTIYGVELMQDNVEECYGLIMEDIIEFSNLKNIIIDKEKVLEILQNNIICSDIFEWDFNKWQPKNKSINALF